LEETWRRWWFRIKITGLALIEKSSELFPARDDENKIALGACFL
jgi:hypothetical protein